MRPQPTYRRGWTAWALSVALLAGCAGERDREAEIEALIRETVAERVVTYREARRERCQEDILEEANRQVDSILIWEATLEGGKAKPPRPRRPSPPPVRQLDDTLPLAPLLPTDTLPAPDTAAPADTARRESG